MKLEKFEGWPHGYFTGFESGDGGTKGEAAIRTERKRERESF